MIAEKFNIFDNNIFNKLKQIDKISLSLLLLLSIFGLLMLYSAGNSSIHPWMIRQLLYFIVFFIVMFIVAVIDIRIWFNLSYILYFLSLFFLILVAIKGHNAMGATRWIKIGFFNFQPSEIVKIFTIFALAKYFNSLEYDKIAKIRYIFLPIIAISIPFLLILKQPDLGTAVIFITSCIILLFISGIKIWKFIVAIISFIISVPLIWNYILYDYQKERILNFLNPERDPLNSGYNIIQSKIAIGSGGLFGKGLGHGTQGQLNFLPEKHTDFIFTMIAEEFGFFGCILVIILYFSLIYRITWTASNINHQFGKLVIIGIISIFFLHFFINIAMVIGILPVVGAPLPLLSYGGTMTASILIGFGFIFNMQIHKNSEFMNNRYS